MWRTFLLSSLFLLAMASAPALGQQPHVYWRTNLSQGLQSARDLEKPLVLFFESDGCHYCSKMKRSTLSDPKIHVALNHFVPVRLNAKEYPELANQLGVKAFPTTIIVKSDGQILVSRVGYRTAAGFYSDLAMAWRASRK